MSDVAVVERNIIRVGTVDTFAEHAEYLGVLTLPSHVLALGDGHLVDTTWTRGGQGGIAVEFEGDQSEYIAKRQLGPTMKIEQVDEDAWRVVCLNKLEAGMLADTGERYARAENIACVITQQHVDASGFAVRDAARKGKGAGLAGSLAGMAVRGAGVAVTAIRDVTGRVVELRLRAV
jgi:hypothetical protein